MSDEQPPLIVQISDCIPGEVWMLLYAACGWLIGICAVRAFGGTP